MFLQNLSLLARRPLPLLQSLSRTARDDQRLPACCMPIPSPGDETRPMIFRSEAFAEDLLELDLAA